MPYEFDKEIRLLLRALKIHGEKIQDGEILAVTLCSLLGALCDLCKMTPLQLQTLGVWILEAAFSKRLEDDPTTNEVQKIILDHTDPNLPGVAYLRMRVWHATQVEALHLEDQVQPLEMTERMIPPPRPEDN
jgi:hypothetical protein